MNAEPTYQNPDLSVERRVDDLLAQMTLQEQVHQLASFFPTPTFAWASLTYSTESACTA